MSLDSCKTCSELIVNLITGIAIIVGGAWTYMLFVKERIRFPKATLSQEIQAVRLNNSKLCIHSVVNIKNIGKVVLSIQSAKHIIYQIKPLPGLIKENIDHKEIIYDEFNKEINWPVLDKRSPSWKEKVFEVEPGEEDTVHFDSLIPSEVEIINVYTYFENITKHGREIGWHTSSIYNVQEILK
jgi:hypothetical protein